jgi:regulator of protease activity HflC (stomatin/prohibitin superfamily)
VTERHGSVWVRDPRRPTGAQEGTIMNRFDITATVTVATDATQAQVQQHAAAELRQALPSGIRNGVDIVAVTVTDVQAVADPADAYTARDQAERDAVAACLAAVRTSN